MKTTLARLTLIIFMDGETWVQDWTNPLAPLFLGLIVDC